MSNQFSQKAQDGFLSIRFRAERHQKQKTGLPSSSTQRYLLLSSSETWQAYEMGTPRVDCSKNADLGAFVSRPPRRRVSQGYLLRPNIVLRPTLRSRPATSGRRRMPFLRLVEAGAEIQGAKLDGATSDRASQGDTHNQGIFEFTTKTSRLQPPKRT